MTPDLPIPEAARESLVLAVIEKFHVLHPRIPGLEKGDCHCNLLAEIAVDAVLPAAVPYLQARVLRDAADAWEDGQEGFPHSWLLQRANEIENGNAPDWKATR